LVKADDIRNPGSGVDGNSQKIDGHIILEHDFDNPGGMLRINAPGCGLKEFKREPW
jgi:hypothetical protein